jgi:hypothetical protein
MSLKVRNLEAERVFVKTVLAQENEISQNYILVQEDSVTIIDDYRRKADDESYLDPECLSLGMWCRMSDFVILLRRIVPRWFFVDLAEDLE